MGHNVTVYWNEWTIIINLIISIKSNFLGGEHKKFFKSISLSSTVIKKMFNSSQSTVRSFLPFLPFNVFNLLLSTHQKAAHNESLLSSVHRQKCQKLSPGQPKVSKNSPDAICPSRSSPTQLHTRTGLGSPG